MMILNRAFVAAFAVTLTACATHARPMSSYFVKQGTPTVSYDDPDTPKHAGAKPAKVAADPLTEHSPRLLPDSGTTVEHTDKALSDALKKVHAAGTAANHLAVAAQYRRLRILDRAFDEATLALKRDGRSAAAFEQRAQIWREWGFPQLGLPDAQRAVFFAPRSASAQNTLGTVLQSVGQTEAARGAFMHVLDLDPSAGYAWSNLCYLSLLTGNTARALDECAAAVRDEPGSQTAHANTALSYAAAGRVQEARQELLASSNPADGAFNVGMLYLALGHYQLAEESFRTASDLRPNFSAAITRRRQAANLAAAELDSHDHSSSR